MELSLSDEQLMLRESALRFVRDSGAAAVADPHALWRTFADLGWLALVLPAEYDGLGGSVLDATLLLEEFGRGLLVTPYVSTVLLGGGLVQALGTDAQKSTILPDVAAGNHLLALAHTEAGPRGNVAPLKTLAVVDEDGWHLSGAKVAVIGGAEADTLIVSAYSQGETALFLVPRGTAGVSVTDYSMPGGGRSATVTFADVVVSAQSRLGCGDTLEAIAVATDVAITALCAESVGIMAALLDATVAYTNTREQFGKPLNANQSVRFKLADMAVALEEARSLSLRAALSLASSESDRIRAVSGAKSGIGRGARRVAELAIQLHGGMGVTEELTVGAFYKRILAIDATLGGNDYHLARHAQASGRLPAQKEPS